MTVLNWENVLEFSANNLTEDLKDELGSELVKCDIESQSDVSKLQHMLKISQQILLYKNEQVEALTTEIDNLAAHQGEYEVQNRQSLQEEIDQLRAQLSQAARFKDLSKDDSALILQQEVAKLEVQNEQLLLELREKEKDFLNEKKETEKFAEQVTTLEKEKNELLRELSSLHREINDYSDTKSRLSTPLTPTGKEQDLTDTIRQKNRQITELLEDIQIIENENSTLKENLTVVRDELTVATKSVSELTNQSLSLKLALEETKEKLNTKNQEVSGLKNQVSELVSEKKIRDSQLDGLISALDVRVKQWQNLLNEKDAELKALKNQLLAYGSDNSQITGFAQVLRKREEQVEELQKQLKQATYDLEESADLLLKCKPQEGAAEVPKSLYNDLKLKLQFAEEEIKVLTKRAEHAELEAHTKAEQVSELIILLRERESGTSSESLIRELQKQKSIRDHHIDRLIQAGNSLQEETERLEYENIALREKFSVPKDEEIPIEGVKNRIQEEKLKLKQLEQELENAQATINSLKIDNRKLTKKLNLKVINQAPCKPISISPSSSDIEERVTLSQAPSTARIEDDASKFIDETLQTKLTEIINENEALRVGLHEVLESIHGQDGVHVQIKSQCLERLLEALDARHISGWYHPAMRLQAQLHNLQGFNSSLREQLYQAKVKETQLLEKLQHCNAFMGQVENYVSSLENTSVQDTQQSQPTIKQEELPAVSTGESTNINRNEDDRIQLEALEKKLEMTEQKLEEEKRNSENTKETLLKKIEDLKCVQMEIEAQLNELKSSWESMRKNPDSLQQQLADLALRASSLAGECQRSERKCKALQDNENRLTVEKVKIEAKLDELTQSSRRDVELMAAEKNELLLDVARLEQLVENSVALSVHDDLKHQNFDLSIKYKALLNKQPAFISAGDALSKFEIENQRLIAETDSKINGMLKTLEKTFSNQDKAPSDQVSLLNEQLSASNAKLLVESQRAEYLAKVNQSLKDQLMETETRCQNLQSSLTEVEESCRKLELSEAILRDKLFSFIDSDSYNQLQKKCLDLEKRLVFMDSEHQRLTAECDLIRTSTSKFVVEHGIMQLKFDSLKRQVLELQSASDDKLLLGQLMQEVEFVREKSLKDEAEIEELKLKIQGLESTNHQLKIKLSESATVNVNCKDNFLRKQRLFQEIVAGLLEHWVDGIPRPTRECWVEKLRRLSEEKAFAWEQLKQALSVNDQKTIELLENQPMLKSNKLKLQSISLQLTAEKLEKRLELAESRLQKQEELSNRLEEELVTLDKEWENKLRKWTSSLVEISDSESEPKPVKEQKTDINTKDINKNLRAKLNQANGTLQKQAQKIKHLESEVRSLEKRLSSLQKQTAEKDGLLASKESTIRKLETEILDLTESLAKTEVNSVETLALKATIDSLQNIVNQKEETMRRYQTLLNESREERSSAEALLQKEMQNLQEKLNSVQVHSSNRGHKSDEGGENPPVHGYITKVHELEDELANVNTQVQNLSSQLSVAQQLANQWSNAATDAVQMNEQFDSKPGSSRMPKEETVASSKLLENKDEEIAKLKKEVNTLKRRLIEKEENEKNLKQQVYDAKEQINSTEQQLTASKTELSRLKHQFNVKAHTVSSVREEQLKKKVKILEEQLERYVKEENEENKLRKERCAKEVEKWQASKKWQATNDKLKAQLKDSLTQLEASRSTVEKLKELLGKIEKDKMMLEIKLKNNQSKVHKSSVTQSLIEELQRENKRLEEELSLLRKTFNLTTGSTSLVSVIEAQDRKIKSLETYSKCSKSKSTVEEMEKLFEKLSTMQKLNHSLEEKNLELSIQLEDLKADQDIRRQDIYRNMQMSSQQKDQVQIKKLESELNMMRENYLNAMKQVSDLKTELRMRELQQSKRLPESDEIKQLRAQLNHKNALLSQVKVSLGRAVASGIHS
nr:PREDICTED: centrosomal protein of 290 kDa-like [Bemisia tabaci]